MQPDHDKIIGLLSAAQESQRLLMVRLLEAGAQPYMLRSLLDASCGFDQTLLDLTRGDHRRQPLPDLREQMLYLSDLLTKTASDGQAVVPIMPTPLIDPGWLDQRRGDVQPSPVFSDEALSRDSVD